MAVAKATAVLLALTLPSFALACRVEDTDGSRPQPAATADEAASRLIRIRHADADGR